MLLKADLKKLFGVHKYICIMTQSLKTVTENVKVFLKLYMTEIILGNT